MRPLLAVERKASLPEGKPSDRSGRNPLATTARTTVRGARDDGSVTLPVPLRFAAQLLRQDGAQATGRAVLFASIVGFDAFEAHSAELAPLCGVSQARLRELVAIGRQALSDTSPKVREQHLVSRVLLREFCRADADGGGMLVSHALSSGRNRPTGPGGVAYREHFVKIDSKETERIWGRVEQELPAALSAANTRRILGQPEHLAAIKEAVALHFARSPDVLDGQAVTLRQAIDTLHAEYVRNWPLVEALYYMKHRLYPPHGDRARHEIADDLLAQTRQLADSGALFRLRVVDLFEKACEMAGWMGVRILRPRRGEFLIGDVPVIPLDEISGAFGLSHGGVAFGDATMVVLPLGPRRLAALTRGPDSFEAIARAEVDQLNRLQVANARTHVAFRRGSGLERLVRRLAEGPSRTEQGAELALACDSSQFC